jgi:leucyl/phenylalanyl-tRNA---protein transferase
MSQLHPTWLNPHAPQEFPPLESALRDPNGLLAVGGDLYPERLIAAYRRGIFPWYSQGQPILWWSPDPRMVLIPSELKISRSLSKTLRKSLFEVRFDTAFDQVISACGHVSLRPDGTWITNEMREGYIRLHQLGLAHSVEVYSNDQLVGGLYGVALGKVFFGESMFSRVSDASKVALTALCEELTHRKFVLIDCQMTTSHLQSLGAKEIFRSEFAAILAQHAVPPDPVGRWTRTNL